MKTKIDVDLAFGVLVVFVLLTFVSCFTLIGALAGAAAEDPSANTVTSWEATGISPGKPVTVLHKDGHTVDGIYRGLAVFPKREYEERFSRSRSLWPAQVFLPQPGDTIRVTYKTHTIRAYELYGYDFNGVKVVNEDGKTQRSVLYQDVDIFGSATDWAVTSSDLKNLVDTLRIPFLSAMILDNPNRQQLIDLGEVQQVTWKTHNRMITGLIVGAVVDVAIILIATSEIFKPAPPPPPKPTGQGSCPFVRSYDGSEYVLDSETFGGAIAKSLQRSDFDNLEHVADRNNLCQLKITNELRETEYVDELKLLAVDHPQQSRVIPSASGELHTISQPKTPTSAKDFRDNNVLPLVASRDDNWWISNPFGRDPDQPSTVRDGLIVCFERPAGSKSVKLAFNLQNTLWSTEVETKLLKLQGSNLNSWYDEMNTSKEFRDEFVEVATREAMLALSFWNGQSWTHAGYIWFVGPHVSKTQVMELNIAGISENELRIRLESTAGLWMVNSIEADFTPDLPVNVVELSTATAIDHAGGDIRSLLNTIDDIYYVMERPGISADIAFDVPPRQEGMLRTYVLKSTGYYTVHVTGEGEPQLSLLKRLATEPGAFGSYSIRLLNNFVSSQTAVLMKEGKPQE